METLTLEGAYSNDILVLGLSPYSPIPNSYSDVDIACFLGGTLIATPTGDRPIESVIAGDFVLDADGVAHRIRWLGRSAVSTRFHDRLRGFPIRTRAGAVGECLPKRDLLVSPDHAILRCGFLIQAGALVNDITIVRETNMPEVFTSYHLELDQHRPILAEGAATESFVDNLGRISFDNWDEHPAPTGEETAELPYARAKSARELPTSLQHLLAERMITLGHAVAIAA